MRLLIFGDVNGPVPANAILATLRAADEHHDLEVCGFVTTHPQHFERAPLAQRARQDVRRMLVAAVNGARLPQRGVVRRIDTRAFAVRGIPVVVPHDRNANSPDFLRRLEDELKPDVALSYFCGTIFQRALLERLPDAVNLHPAALPRYRGLRSVGFARYHGEPSIGLTWHRMTEKIDDGPILLQKQVDTGANESFASLTDRLASVTAAAVPEVLELLRSNAPGTPQQGAASYFSARDVDALVDVTDPSAVAHDELLRRLWAFDALRITIDGTSRQVTRLRSAREGDRLAFRTSDGVLVAPDRIAGLPLAFVRR